MQLSASKFIYPSNLTNLIDTLLPFSGFPIQLAFFQRRDFLTMEHKKIKDCCDELKIDIISVHFPTVDVFHDDFLDTLKIIHQTYNVNIITIHPQKCEREIALGLLRKYAQQISDRHIVLAYENFPAFTANRKWINSVKDMYTLFDLPFLRITFDTSHLDKPNQAFDELQSVIDKVAVVHLSDKKDKKGHLPIGYGAVPAREILRYLDSIKFSGPVVLEYLSKYTTQLIDDIKKYNRISEEGN